MFIIYLYVIIITEGAVQIYIMKVKKFLLILFCFLLFCSPVFAKVSAEKGVYTVTDVSGQATIVVGKKAPAREQAKQAAYRDALEQAMEACIPEIKNSSEYDETREKVFSKASTLVKNFKITDEKLDGDIITVTGTCQISEKKLDEILGPQIISKLGNPRVMIIVDERVGKEAPFISTVEGELLRMFENAGYLIVDPDQAKMLLNLDPQKAFNDPSLLSGAARTLRADIIILARAIAGAFANQKIHGINLYGVSGTVQLKAVLTQTAYQISSKTISGATGKKPVQTVGGGAERIFRSAVSQAAEEIIYKIAYSMASAGSALGKPTINIKIAGVDFKKFEEIKKNLSEFASDGEVFVRSFNNGQLEIDLVSSKSSESVASFLSDYASIETFTPQNLVARIAPAGPVKPVEPERPAALVTINIHIENVRWKNDAMDIENGVRNFVGPSGEVKCNYSSPVVDITVTYSEKIPEGKGTEAIKAILEKSSINIENLTESSMKGWRKGWL